MKPVTFYNMHTSKKIFLILVTLLMSVHLFSQAGSGIYTFLSLPYSSHLAALGGNNVSIRDNDINFSFNNPALLTEETNKNIGLNYTSYLGGISIGSVIYGFNLDEHSYLAAGIHYIDYGQFQETTEENQILGTFTAKDYALNLIYARKLTEKWTVGATLKPIYSAYESYTSFGVAADAGVSFADETSLWSAGLVLKNMGSQLKSYYSADGTQHRESLPFEIQMGVSKKFEHAPLRISITANNLQKWNLSYVKNNTDLNQLQTQSYSFGSLLFRHLVFAVDFIPNSNFYITAAYNYRRAAEMSIDNIRSMSGFAGGFGIKISKVHAGFSMAEYQIGNISYNFSVTTSLSDFGL